MLPTSIVLCIRRRTAPSSSLWAPRRAARERSAHDQPRRQVVGGRWATPVVRLERALKKDKAKWVGDYPLPVVIVEGIDQYEEMRYFHVINTRHKGVPTDVVDRHLLDARGGGSGPHRA